MILFALALWGLFLQANGREAAGGIALAAAAAMKVMAIAFLPYLLYRKRWRAAFWMAAASLVFFFSPALILGWAKFWDGVALWLPALHASWGAGNAHQSVYSMWDRILGYGYIPFAVPGTFMLPLSGARSAKLAWEITCAIAGVLAAIACRGTPRPGSRWAQVEWAVVFVAATILSPLTRKPYFVVLLLPYALLYAAWRSTDLDPRARRRVAQRDIRVLRAERAHDARLDWKIPGRQVGNGFRRDLRIVDHARRPAVVPEPRTAARVGVIQRESKNPTA